MLPATTPTPPATEVALRNRRRFIGTAVAGVLAFVIGTTIFTVANIGLMGVQLLGWALLDPRLLLWVGAVIVLGFAGRRLPDVGFAAISVALAPVCTLLAVLAQQTGAGAPPPLWAIMFVSQAAGLLGAATVGSITGVVLARRTTTQHAVPPNAAAPVATAPDAIATNAAEPGQSAGTRARSGTGLSIAVIVLLVMGSALAFALPMQWFSVYFSIWDAAPPPTESDGDRYLWTAGLALVFLLAAFVVAIVRRGGGLIVLTVIAVSCALIGAFVFQVPQGRFVPEPEPYDGPPHPVCYGTTGDCPGG